MGQVRAEEKEAIILGQEFGFRAKAAAEHAKKFEKQGWRTAIVPGVPGEGGGTRAGVLLGVPPNISMTFCMQTQAGKPTWDASQPSSPGRLAVCWADAVAKGGVVLGSTYLWCNEGAVSGDASYLRNILVDGRNTAGSLASWDVPLHSAGNFDAITNRWVHVVMAVAGGTLAANGMFGQGQVGCGPAPASTHARPHARTQSATRTLVSARALTHPPGR